MTTAPTVNGQVIGQAHYATRAVLESVLAATGTTFHQSVALNATADSGGSTERHLLLERMTSTLKIDATTVETVLAGLIAQGLLEQEPGDAARLTMTPAGSELHHTHRAALTKITDRLYADLPAEDLAAAGRVLTEVTARADAVLAEG
ncbi:MarR family winged helix-turn-helix transcriptional regulator [Streptomyces sp. NPDC005761]|uniref:MarR family winged helix-turn-helix transcriptional regulator n=1 Tax=unclassified Streptomyces TaxID=2593676 RepID=UPI0033CDD2F7